MKSENPLSLPEVGYSTRFNEAIKRVLRIAWLLAANSTVAWVMFLKIRSSGFPSWNFQLYFEFAFEVVFPMAGIALEAANWEFARLLNVGTFTIAGILWLAAAVLDRTDPFFGVLLIIGLGLLTVAGLTQLVYRGTASISRSERTF